MATYTSNYAWTKPAGSDPVDIGVLNNNLDSQDGIMHDAFLNMADPFSESSTYAVGAIVLYGTKTYKCHTAVTTAGSWTGSTNWTAYKLAEGGLTAGNYVIIQNGVINVQTEIGTYNYVRYEMESTGGGHIKLIVRKYVNNVLDSTTEYPNDGQHHEIDDVMDIWYEYGSYLWHYKLLVASTDHAVGYEESWSYQDTSVHTVNFQFAQDDSTTLVTKGDLDDALDDKVDKVTGKGLSTNDYDNTAKGIVDGVTANLALKADKTATASGETLALVPTSEGRALLHTAYGMSTQSGTPTPSSPVDIESAKADFRCVGKNLHDVSVQLPRTNVDTTATYNSDGTFTIDGTASGQGAQLNGIINGFSISDLKAGDKLVVSYEVISGSASHLSFSSDTAIYLYKTSGNIGGIAFPTTLSKGDKGSVIIDITNDLLTDGKLVYNGVQMWIRSGDVFNKLQLAIMIRRYGTDDTFEPYTKHDTTTDLTLRAIEVTSSDDYNLVRDGKYYVADTLDYSEDNGWTVTRRVQLIEGNGLETVNEYGSGTANHRFVVDYQTSYNVGANDTLLYMKTISDRFGVVSGGISREWGAFKLDGEHLSIYDSGGTIADTTAFSAWMSTNKPHFQYALATPTTETITTEQALALLGLKTYDESTTISSQAEPSCTIAVEYAKERLGALALTAYNTAKGNDLRITALEG